MTRPVCSSDRDDYADARAQRHYYDEIEMLASLIANVAIRRSIGSDDVWRRRNRKSRRDEIQRLLRLEREQQKEYLLKRENEKLLTEELTQAYRKLKGLPTKAAKLSAIVAPFVREQNQEPATTQLPAEIIDFRWIAKQKMVAKEIITMYYDVLDDDLLLILNEGA